MNAQADKFSWLAVLITGLAIILFSTAGIARMMGWGPHSTVDSDDVLAPDQAASLMMGEARAQPRCPECGMIVSIESMQKIESGNGESGLGPTDAALARNRDETRVNSTERHEIIVRMADGSTRVIDDAYPARWRPGQRLIVIAGAEPSDR
jgi:hypothetical protein